jgi:hypothetical protein
MREISDISGIEIFQIRLWLDFAIENKKVAMDTCPFGYIWGIKRLKTSLLDITSDEFIELVSNKEFIDSMKENDKCDWCRHLTKETKIEPWKHKPCPCHIYSGDVYAIIDMISTLLLEHRGLVNKKTQELKQKLVDSRVKKSMKDLQDEMKEK